MRGTAHPLQVRFTSVAQHDTLDAVFGELPAIPGEEEVVAVALWIRPVGLAVAPEAVLHFPAERNETLLVAFPQYLENPFFETDIAHFQSGQFGDPESGIQQSQDNGVVAVAVVACGIDGRQQPLDLVQREGLDHLAGHPRQLHTGEWRGSDNLLRHQPRPESPDAAQVAVHGVVGKLVRPLPDERVVGETGLLPEVEDECPDLAGADEGGVARPSHSAQELVKVPDAAGDNSHRARALSFSAGAELVAGEEGEQVGPRI